MSFPTDLPSEVVMHNIPAQEKVIEHSSPKYA